VKPKWSSEPYDRLEAVKRDVRIADTIPSHTNLVPTTERDQHDIAGQDLQMVWNEVVEHTGNRERQQDWDLPGVVRSV
jgi:hypothetical protein